MKTQLHCPYLIILKIARIKVVKFCIEVEDDFSYFFSKNNRPVEVIIDETIQSILCCNDMEVPEQFYNDLLMYLVLAKTEKSI